MEEKFEEIISLALDQRFDIFAVSETWLNYSVSSQMLYMPGFNPLFRLDKRDGRRAGVALYTSTPSFSDSDRESNWSR